jgi:hypothetical protein
MILFYVRIQNIEYYLFKLTEISVREISGLKN